MGGKPRPVAWTWRIADSWTSSPPSFKYPVTDSGKLRCWDTKNKAISMAEMWGAHQIVGLSESGRVVQVIELEVER